VCALWLVFGSLGCTPTEWVPARYGAPLTGDHAANLETNRCAHDCYDQAGDSAHFYACLSSCPGVVRLGSSTCDDPAETPEAFCYTQWLERDVKGSASGSGSAESTAANVFGAIFEAVLNGLLRSGSSHDGHQHARRESGEPHRRTEERRERPRRSESSREPRRYIPASPRRR